MPDLNLIELRLDAIRTDGGTQSRVQLNEVYAEELADHLRAGGTLPPATVFRNGDRINWMGAGFHRHRAHLLVKRKTMICDLRAGGQRDALLFSVSSNLTQGRRPTPEDKRFAVGLLLHDEEWGQWATAEIARRCGVSQSLVRLIRREEDEAANQAGASSRGAMIGHKCKRGNKVFRTKATRTPKPKGEDVVADERRAILLDLMESIQADRDDLAAMGEETAVAVAHMDAALACIKVRAG